MVAVRRVMMSTGAGAHQWNLRYKEFFDMLYVWTSYQHREVTLIDLVAQCRRGNIWTSNSRN